jgi:hypothetical protein
MEHLISNSVAIFREENTIQVAYSWMDIGDLICEKQRSNKPFKEQEMELVNKLETMVKRITLEDNITLYRGTTKEFDPAVAEKQFSALSPNLNTAETYGQYLVEVIVPKGTNAFYISAWELINTAVEEQEEKEVLLLPGKFTLREAEGNCATYLYTQC